MYVHMYINTYTYTYRVVFLAQYLPLQTLYTETMNVKLCAQKRWRKHVLVHGASPGARTMFHKTKSPVAVISIFHMFCMYPSIQFLPSGWPSPFSPRFVLQSTNRGQLLTVEFGMAESGAKCAYLTKSTRAGNEWNLLTRPIRVTLQVEASTTFLHSIPHLSSIEWRDGKSLERCVSALGVAHAPVSGCRLFFVVQ